MLSVDWRKIQELGRSYPWPRPARCPRCQWGQVWGHGYVLRFFDGVPEALWMKRWRCPHCHAVHTARPVTHWRRFWSPWIVIVLALLSKQRGGRWLSGLSRQRQQYWWHGLLRQRQVSALSEVRVLMLLCRGIMAATHSLTDREIHLLVDTTYLSLAATEYLLHAYAPP